MNVLNSVFSLSSASGVFSLSFDSENVSINYRILVISLIIRLVFLAEIFNLGIYYLSDLVSSPEKNIEEVCMIIQYSTTFACAIYIIRKRDEFTLLNQYFSKIDGEFLKLGISPCYKMKWLGDVFVLLLSLLTYLVVPILSKFDAMTVDYCCEIIFEIYVTWQCFAIVQPFVQCVRIVGNKISKVREVFSTLSHSKNYFDIKNKLESTISLYDMLCSTSDLLLDLFSLQLLFVFFLVLLNVVVAAFRLLLTIKSHPSIFDFLSHFLNLTYHTVLCVYITTYCKRTSEEAEEFNSVLNEVMIDEGTSNLSDNRKLRLHVIMKREVTFSALGFLNLDYTLVHSVIAAATTYLVILLQFTDDTPAPTPPTRSSNIPY